MTKVAQRRTRRSAPTPPGRGAGAARVREGSDRRAPPPSTRPAGPPVDELGVRARQKQDTRERIRRAALELFQRDGYEATTTKAVAARAGVAAGTVFVHASDKEDLLFLVMHDEIVRTVDAQLDSLPEGAPLLEQLLHLFGGIYRMYGRFPEMARAFVKGLPGARGPNGQRVSANTFAFLHRVAALIQTHQARGALDPDVEPLLLAQNVFALYYFALTSWLGGYTTLETALDPHLRMALELQLRGLSRPAGST